MDSLCGFKNMYYVARPLTERSKSGVVVCDQVLDKNNAPVVDEARDIGEIVILLFPFFCSNRYFHHKMRDMVTKLKDLSVLDASDKNSFCCFVHSLKKEVFRPNGNVLVEQRFIETWELVVCQSQIEVDACLISRLFICIRFS